MNNSWMIFYKLVDGQYELAQFGSNIVPTGNFDKVIQVPEEIARQAFKFEYDGNKLKRKEGFYVMTLEQLKEKELQNEIELWGEKPPHQEETKEKSEITIEF